MFPLRSFLRSPSRLQALRPVSRPSFRPPQRPYYLHSPRPATLGARIWFRADGTPRSKLRGLVITSLLSGFAYATWATLLVVEALDYEHYLLSTLVHIQRVDYDYATVSFPSFRASLEYFADLCAYLGQPQGEVPPEMVAAFFADVAALAESDEALCETAHAIICAAAETVHDVLGDSKGEDAVETAVRVVDVIDRAVMGLIELTEEAGEDETDKMLRVRKMREQMTAKEKEAAKSYEILG